MIRIAYVYSGVQLVEKAWAVTRKKVINIQLALLKILIREQRRVGALDLAVRDEGQRRLESRRTALRSELNSESVF